MLTLQINVCMYEFMYAKCSAILISKLFPNGIIFIDFNFHLHQMLNKTSSLDTVILSWIKKTLHGRLWTNSRPQYLTIPIKLIPIDHIPFRRATMDSFCSVIMYAMSWTRRWSFSFSFWSSEAFFSSSVFSDVYPVFLSWIPPLMVANSSFFVDGIFCLTYFVFALEKFGNKLFD